MPGIEPKIWENAKIRKKAEFVCFDGMVNWSNHLRTNRNPAINSKMKGSVPMAAGSRAFPPRPHSCLAPGFPFYQV